VDFPIIQYADDTLLIMPADKLQLMALKETLRKFSLSTGLRINFDKSQMVPVNVEDDLLKELAAEFGCQIGQMLFTYLGLPLGTTRPTIAELSPLVCRLERKLTSSSSFLSQGARLQLINSALSSMPLHFLCTLQLPPGLTNQLDRILRQCLWRDKDGVPKQSLAAMVCKPKKKGGLGIINFQKQNAALLIKFLDKFYNKRDIPWIQLIWNAHYQGKLPHEENMVGSFWWKDVLRQVDNFRRVASVTHGQGDTISFWNDNWDVAQSILPMSIRFPRLHSYALQKDISVSAVYQLGNLHSLFYLPMSQPAHLEFQTLESLMQDNPLLQQKDEWTYCWGKSYSAKRFYDHIHSHIQVPNVYQWLWKSCCIMKTKVFAWLLLSDRLNTRDLLQRRNWHVSDDKHCELCPLRAYEDRVHLFFECNFSARIWTYLQIDWQPLGDIQSIVHHARRNFRQPFFMEVLITACWNIWLIRNAKIFRRERSSFTKWKGQFIHDMTLLQYRIKAKYKDNLMSWIRSLP
jgi:hypothetical protein